MEQDNKYTSVQMTRKTLALLRAKALVERESTEQVIVRLLKVGGVKLE